MADRFIKIDKDNFNRYVDINKSWVDVDELNSFTQDADVEIEVLDNVYRLKGSMPALEYIIKMLGLDEDSVIDAEMDWYLNAIDDDTFDDLLDESSTEEITAPTEDDIKWLNKWLDLSKESYLKGWEDGHAYIVFGAKSKLDDDGFNPENDWGIINALIKRGFKYKLTQGDYAYKTVGTFNPRSMSYHNRGFDRTLKNRVRLDIYWGDNEKIDDAPQPIDESLKEAYINAPKEVLDIIRADKEYGQNYIMRDYTPDFSAIPNGTVIEVKDVNKYHSEVKDTYTKVDENEWKYTHDYGKGSWTTMADNQDVVHHIAEIDRGAYESLKQETDMNKLTESESLQEKQESSNTKKESAKVREAISLITGNLAKSGGYKIEDTKIIIDPEGEKTTFEFSKQVINRLKELGYGEDMKESMNKLTEAVDRNALVKFIKNAIEDLKGGFEGTYFFDLGSPNGLHLVIGWTGSAEDWDNDVEDYVTDPSGKYVVGAKLAVNSDDLQDDYWFDWNMPYDTKTGDTWDTDMAVSKLDSPESIADWYLDEFNKMKDLDIDEDGAIIEHEEVVEESVDKEDCDDDCEKESKLVYDALSEYQANHFDDLKDVENDFINSTIDKFAMLAGVFNDVDESCKDKKTSKKKLDEAYGLEDRMDAIDAAMSFFYSIGLSDFADNLLKEFEMNEDDSGELGYFTDVPADNINRLYDRCREEVVTRLNDGVDLGRYKDEIIELFDISQVYESCNKGKVDECKDKKSLKEDMNSVQKAVYNYMSKDGGYVNDDMFDLLCDLVERVDDYNDDDDIRSAVDDGMIYTDDQWTAYRYFCDMGDSVDVMWEALYLAVVEICTELSNADTEDKGIDEKVEQSITESTGLKVKDVLNFELEDDGTEAGGIPYKGYTVEDFLDEVAFSSDGVTFQFEDDKDKDIALESPVEDLNAILVQCGIKPIKK